MPTATALGRWAPGTDLSERQRTFVDLDCDEAFYGGAAGGGKSFALWLWVLQGVDIPGYRAVIFRRTMPQLEQPGGLIELSQAFLRGSKAVWNGNKYTWAFPSGAKIRFCHLQHNKDVENHHGAQYHRIGFDELTHFTEFQYTYLFSRLRRVVDFPIRPGMRSGSNPGGSGHLWVKRRFISKEAEQALKDGRLGTFWKPGCGPEVEDVAFVPAKLDDNPFLDRADYRAKLARLDPLNRRRLEDGDWSVHEGSIIKESWFRYFTRRGTFYVFQDQHGRQLDVIDPLHCTRFITIDCAATSEEVARERRGIQPSASVISTWDWHPGSGKLIWMDLARGYWDFPTLLAQTIRAIDAAKPAWTGVEDEKTGRALLQMLQQKGYMTRPLATEGKDKLTRAAALINMLEQGLIYTPWEAMWRSDCEAELVSWAGHADDPWDRGDTAAYAAREMTRFHGGGVIDIVPLMLGTSRR